MVVSPGENTNAGGLDPKVRRWISDYQIYNQERFPVNPSTLVFEGPESPKIKNLGNDDFRAHFLQTMNQGVALDDNNNPHFFHPQTFLRDADRKIYRMQARDDDYANGISNIIMFKNLPENRLNLELQQDARAAIMEYLDVGLFAGNLADSDELSVIFEALSSDALEAIENGDSDVMECFNAAALQRKNLINAIKNEADQQSGRPGRKVARSRARKTAYNQDVDYTPNPGSFQFDSRTTIDEILQKLQNSPNRAGFKRIRALKKWGDFIRDNVKNPNYEEQIISFGTDPRFDDLEPQYSDDDTYAVIAFDYAGHRCMIAESCGRGGSDSVAAAMKIWRGNLADKRGWRQVFAQSKSDASSQKIGETLRHADFAPQHTDQDIDEAEDLMFRSALNYFETGKSLGTGKQAAEKLAKLIGPQMWRPNVKK